VLNIVQKKRKKKKKSPFKKKLYTPEGTIEQIAIEQHEFFYINNFNYFFSCFQTHFHDGWQVSASLSVTSLQKADKFLR
jgi:hypothetical protein